MDQAENRPGVHKGRYHGPTVVPRIWVYNYSINYPQYNCIIDALSLVVHLYNRSTIKLLQKSISGQTINLATAKIDRSKRRPKTAVMGANALVPNNQCQSYPCLIELSSLKDGVSAEGKNEIRDINMRKMMEKKKLHLVINVDNNTLFRCIDSNHIELRPYAPIFIQEISAMYDITFYTKTDSIAHLERIYSALDPVALYLNDPNTSFIIDHPSGSKNEGGRRRRLDSLLAHDRIIVVVDVMKDGWEDYLGNLLTLTPHGGDRQLVHRSTIVYANDVPVPGLIVLKRILKYMHEKFFMEDDDDNRYDHDVKKINESSSYIFFHL